MPGCRFLVSPSESIHPGQPATYETYRVRLEVEIDGKDLFGTLGLSRVSILAMPSRARWLEVCSALARRSTDRSPSEDYDFPLHGAPVNMRIVRWADTLDVFAQLVRAENAEGRGFRGAGGRLPVREWIAAVAEACRDIGDRFRKEVAEGLSVPQDGSHERILVELESWLRSRGPPVGSV